MKNIKKKIKCVAFRDDRIGMQLYTIINAIYYCRKNNYEYIHIPLDCMYIEYENIFRLGEEYKKMSKEKYIRKHLYEETNVRNIGRLFSLIKRKNKEKEILKKSNINYKSSNFKIYQNELIDKYITSEFYKKMYIDNTINICIHYRRGDVKKLNKNRFNDVKHTVIQRYNLRYTPDDYINQIISKLNTYMYNIPLNIHVHSDSELDLNNLIKIEHKFKIITHFDTSHIDAMNSMIQSDILFRYGISAFSGVAAFYNKNIVISKIQPKYERLYNFSNTYNFKKCDAILEHLANRFIDKIKLYK